MIKLKTVKPKKRVARMAKSQAHKLFSVENLTERDQVRDLDIQVYGKVILKGNRL